MQSASREHVVVVVVGLLHFSFLGALSRAFPASSSSSLLPPFFVIVIISIPN